MNYRIQGDRYIVDTVFKKAILIAGIATARNASPSHGSSLSLTRMSILLLCVFLCLGACSTRTETGNFIENAASTQQVGMAEETASNSLSVSTSGKTRFRLMQETRDIYGVTLLGGLRNADTPIDESGSGSVPQAAKMACPCTITWISRMTCTGLCCMSAGRRSQGHGCLTTMSLSPPAPGLSEIIMTADNMSRRPLPIPRKKRGTAGQQPAHADCHRPSAGLCPDYGRCRHTACITPRTALKKRNRKRLPSGTLFAQENRR